MSRAPRPQRKPSARSPDHGSWDHSLGVGEHRVDVTEIAEAGAIAGGLGRRPAGPVGAQPRDQVGAPRLGAEQLAVEAAPRRGARRGAPGPRRSSPGGFTVLKRISRASSCCASAAGLLRHQLAPSTLIRQIVRRSARSPPRQREVAGRPRAGSLVLEQRLLDRAALLRLRAARVKAARARAGWRGLARRR